MEALSWLIGKEVVHYKTYCRLTVSFNHLLGLLNMDKYPSYGTLLYVALDIMNTSVVMKRCEIESEVNTSRSGVGQRHTRSQQTGHTPTARFTMILPSQWTETDVRQYSFFSQPIFQSVQRPKCIDVEYSPMLPTHIRRQADVIVNELILTDDGYTSRRELLKGDAVIIHITGNDEYVQASLADDPSITLYEQYDHPVAMFRGRLGETQIAIADDHSRGIRMCDAITAVLQRDGSPWRNAILFHRFAPKAGTRATVVIFYSMRDGRRVEMRWVELRQDDDFERIADTLPTSTRVGTLTDGREYVVVCCLLYSDDFKLYAFKNTNCGGFYMIPLCIPTWARSSIHVLRIIS